MQHLATNFDSEVWCPSPVLPLVDFAGRVSAISSTGIDLLGVGDHPVSPALQARLSSFDEIISWYGTNRPEFRAALCAINERCHFLQALPSPECAEHAADFFCRQVGAPLGVETRLTIERVAPRDSVVIHPFSGSAKKNWPLESFKDLAARFPGNVEFTAGPEEPLDGATRFANLRDLAVWIGQSRLYIGNDSGITHLAAATGARVIALFGPTDPDVWRPRGSNTIVLRGEPLTALAVEEVFAWAIC